MVIERTVSGHRLFYVRILLDYLVSKGNDVLFVTIEGGLSSPEAKLHLSGLNSACSRSEVASLEIEEIENISRSAGALLTVVPDGDWLLKSLAKRRGWRGVGKLKFLVMREDAQSKSPLAKAIGSGAKRAVVRLVNQLPRVDAITLKSAVWSGRQRNVARDPVTQLASVDDVQSVRDDFGLSPDRYWFAIVGAITSRKNLPLVASAISRFGNEHVGFLIAGLCAKDELEKAQEFMSRLRDNSADVVLVNRLLTDIEIDAIVGAADCLVLAHSNEGPSGLFGKAANSGTRVVTAGAESLRRDSAFVPQLASWVPLNVDSLSAALKSAMELPTPNPVEGLSATDFARALS